MLLRFIEGKDTSKIVAWRNAAAKYFPPQEPWTHRSHRTWYQSYMVDSNDFIYMICTSEGEPLGTIGITRQGHGTYEIGRVMLGERELAPPGIMSRALQEIMRRHEGSYYWLSVLADNHHAIRFYEKNGFTGKHQHTGMLYMIRTVEDDSAF